MLTLPQVADEPAVTTGQVLDLIHAGDLPAAIPVGQKHPGGWRVERAELEALNQRAHQRTAQHLASLPVNPLADLAVHTVHAGLSGAAGKPSP